MTGKTADHPRRRDVPALHHMMFLHCTTCLPKRPAGISPKDWSRTQTLVTSSGDLMVWCNRCEALVCRFANNDVAEWLRHLGGTACAKCGEGKDHHHG